MDTEYEMVVDAASLLSSMLPLVLHLLIVAAEVGLLVFLLLHGVGLLVNGERASASLARWGALSAETLGPRVLGGGLLALAVLLLAPLLLGLSAFFAGGAMVCSSLALIFLSRSAAATGALARRVILGAALISLAFLSFEGRDPIEQSYDLAKKAKHWRDHELGWQLAHDVDSPKVGDLAPDFELQDPEGEKTVQLASFRGKRPVALVFGSYT